MNVSVQNYEYTDQTTGLPVFFYGSLTVAGGAGGNSAGGHGGDGGGVAKSTLASATGDPPDPAALAHNPELAPLARAYSRPDVHQAVQNALQIPDGPEQLTAELTRRADHPVFQSEIAFWADKTDRAARLPLARALSVIQTPEAKSVLSERGADACPKVRRYAVKKTEDRKQKTETAEERDELDAAA